MILKELILTVSMLGGCGHLEGTGFLTVLTFGGCGSLERTVSNSFYDGKVWWS